MSLTAELIERREGRQKISLSDLEKTITLREFLFDQDQ